MLNYRRVFRVLYFFPRDKRINSKIKRSSLLVLFVNQVLVISLHDMFAPQAVVQSDAPTADTINL